MIPLEGIIPPMVTPLHADETIDEAGLEKQLDRLVTAGIHGLFFLGTTGEQPALRDAEKVKAIKAAARVNRGRVPLIVGCMASGTARAIDNIRAAEAAGADAVAVAPPHYYLTNGPEEQVAHYRACAAATRLPVVIYNIPSTTKVMLAPDTIARIAELGNVIGVKDSSGDMPHVLKVLSLVRGKPGFEVLVGVPAIAAASVMAGASGSVPGVANLDPRLMLDIYAAAIARNVAALQTLHDRLFSLGRVVTFGAPIACFKTALELMGVCGHHTTAPLQPLAEEKRAAIAAILREMELLV
jgi:4-hydroxy-tetrahydrodipicolinate synthase